MFEKLNGPLVFLRGGAALECAQVPPLARLRVDFPRIQPVSSVLEFPDHARSFRFHYGNNFGAARQYGFFAIRRSFDLSNES
jgi:hypothetical protein